MRFEGLLVLNVSSVFFFVVQFYYDFKGCIIVLRQFNMTQRVKMQNLNMYKN